MSLVNYNQIISNSSPGALGSTMSDLQFCANVRADIEDTQGKNFALMADVALLCAGCRFDEDELSMIDDPINHSLSEFTDLSHDNEIRYFRRKDQFRKKRVRISGDDSQDIKSIFTGKNRLAEDAEYINSSFECITKESVTINAIKKSAYGQFVKEDSTTVSDALRDIDDAIPSYENDLLDIPNNKSDDEDINVVIFDLTSRGELTVDGELVPICSTFDEFEEFCITAGFSSVDDAISSIAIDLGINDLITGNTNDDLRILDSKRIGAIYDYAGRSDFAVFTSTDGAMFSIPTDVDGAMTMLSDLADKASCQQVLIDACQVITSGSATVADMSAKLQSRINSGSVAAKQVAESLISIGSNSPVRVAYNFRNTYKALGGQYSEHDGYIEWDLIPPPTFDWSIGSVIVGYLATAAQIVGTFLAFVPVTRIIGALLVGTGTVVKALQHVGADIANTFPDFKFDCIDNCINYPLYQGAISSTNLSTDIINRLKVDNIVKLEHPFYVEYLYNYDESTSLVQCKLFPLISTTGLFTNVPQVIPEDLPPEADWNTQLFPLAQGGVENHSLYFHGVLTKGSGATAGYTYTNCTSVDIGDLTSKILPYSLAGNNPLGFRKLDLRELDTHNSDAAQYHGLWNGIGATVSYLIFRLLKTRAPIELVADNTVANANCLAYSGYGLNGAKGLKTEGTYDSSDADGAGYNITSCNFYPAGNIHSDFRTRAIKIWVIRNAASIFGGTFNDADHSQGVYPDIRSLNPELFGIRGSGNASYYQTVIEHFAWIADFMRYYPNTCVVLANDPLAVISVCYDIDEDWAVRLPQRSYQALLMAEIIAVIVVAVAAAAIVATKFVVKKVLTPWMQRNITDFETERTNWSELQDDLNNEPESSPVDKARVQKEINRGVNALSRRIRRFNFTCRLLGLGGFDMAAGFWDGPVSVGSNWSIGSDDSLDEASSQSSGLAGLYASLSNQPTTEEVEVTTNEIKKLITG